MYKLVIFDFDGVIIDSEPLMRQSLSLVFNKYYKGYSPDFDQFFSFMGESLEIIFNRMGISLKYIEDYKEESNNNIDQIKLFPGTIKLLDVLKNNNVYIALLTGKDLFRTIKILEKLKIYEYFNIIVTSDQIWNPKPHSEGLIKILYEMNISAENTVFVGDSYNDILCAKKSRVKSIGALFGNKIHHRNLLENADFCIYSWHEIYKIINLKKFVTVSDFGVGNL